MLEANGYWACHRNVLPYGIDYQGDIKRLARTMGISVGTFFDVGAHTGETSSTALANFPQAEIFAFEPHPLRVFAPTAKYHGLQAAVPGFSTRAEQPVREGAVLPIRNASNVKQHG
jgi:hypothetical protein